MFNTITEVKEANKAINNYFFSADTMRFFDSKVESKLYVKEQCFITSEKKCFDDYTRVYSVRKAENNGSIKTLVQGLTSKEIAKDYIKDLKE